MSKGLSKKSADINYISKDLFPKTYNRTMLDDMYDELKQRIYKASNDLQNLMNDIRTKTIIGLNEFVPRLEEIQDELIGGSNE